MFHQKLCSPHCQNAEKILLILISFLLYCNSLYPDNFIREIQSSPQSETVQLDGNLDLDHARIYDYQRPVTRPEKILRISNNGDNTVQDIRIILNGEKNWYDFDSWLDEITREADGDLEKALSIFWFFFKNNRHACEGQPLLDPVLYINSYCYGCCNEIHEILNRVMPTLKIPRRSSDPVNQCHAASEYYIDNEFRHLDTDIKVFYPGRDNLEPAGINECKKDPYLIKRVPHYTSIDPDFSYAPLKNHWALSHKVSYFYDRNLLTSKPYGLKQHSFQKINLSLRPGEVFEYIYGNADRILPIKNIDRNDIIADLINNGCLITSLDFTRNEKSNSIGKYRNLIFADQKGLSADNSDREANISIPVTTSHPITGMDISVESDPVINGVIHIRSLENRSGAKRIPMPFDDEFHNVDQEIKEFWPSRKVLLDIRFQSPDVSESFIKSVTIKTYVQISRVSMPELRLGENNLAYSDSSNKRRMEIELIYEPVHDLAPPRSPENAFYPPDGETVHDSKIAFYWSPALDSDGNRITSYHFQLSEYEDMKYPLSPSFDRLLPYTLSSGNSYYMLPFPGLLHPGKEYFWRVRSISRDGLVSDWSPTWSFVPQFPGYPTNLQYDISDEEIFLTWNKPEFGTEPESYEIYGSDVYGFIPHTEPYLIEGFGTGDEPVKKWGDYEVADWEAMHPNLLTTVKSENNRFKVVSPSPVSPAMNRMYYRVVAVDKYGNRSVPSEMIAMPEGFIYSPREIKCIPGDKIAFPVEFIRDKGPITMKPSYFAGLWNQPEYTLRTENLPDGFQVDNKKGLITGKVDKETEDLKFKIKILKNNNTVYEKEFMISVK